MNTHSSVEQITWEAVGTGHFPALVVARPAAGTRFRDFFSSHIRNPNTRCTYLETVRQFLVFCPELGIADLAQVERVHAAAFVEASFASTQHSKPTVKQRLAARHPVFGTCLADPTD
jgi:integrase/recombinase XerD